MRMKMRLKMKNISERYDINSLRPRHEHKYTKYKICLGIMMVSGKVKHELRVTSSNPRVIQNIYRCVQGEGVSLGLSCSIILVQWLLL